MIPFIAMNEAHKNCELSIKNIEDQINASEEWIGFTKALNEILIDKYKINGTPKINCIISGSKDSNIRMYAMEIVKNNFKDIFRYELKDSKKIVADLFSIDNVVTFKSSEGISKYNNVKQTLVSYLDRMTNGYQERESKLYLDYHSKKQDYRAKNEIVKRSIEEHFKNAKFQKKIMDKINTYFRIDSKVEINFSLIVNYDTTKYKDGKHIKMYKINFYIGEYDYYHYLMLGSFTFDVENIEKTLKFKPGLINNINVINEDIKGVSYLRTTLKNNLKKLIMKSI